MCVHFLYISVFIVEECHKYILYKKYKTTQENLCCSEKMHTVMMAEDVESASAIRTHRAWEP